MNDRPATGQRMTGRQLRAIVYNIALNYLEVERGLRPPRQLAAFLTPDERRRHRLTTRGRRADAKPVRPHDIGRVRIDRVTPERVNASVAVRRGEEGWSNLIIDLRRTGRGWQVEKLDRLERLLPHEPREVDIDEDAFEQRVWLVDDERRSVEAAYKAAGRRYDRSDDKRTRSARELRRRRDAWARLLSDVEAEAGELAEQERLGHQNDRSMDRHVRPSVIGKESGLGWILGPRPNDELGAKLWEEAEHAVEAYRDRWQVAADTSLLQAAEASEQESDRRRLFQRLGALERGLESRAATASEQTLDATARAIRPLEQ